MSDRSRDDTHSLPASGRRGTDQAPPTTAVRIDVAGLSDKGKVRDENQDHFLVVRAGRYAETLMTSLPPGAIPERSEDRGLLMMVADGMGGQAAGELASRTVLVTLTHLILNHPEWAMKVDERSAAGIEDRAVARYQALDAALADRMQEDPSLKGMGTTLTVAYSLGLDVFIAHAGDSRAYLLHEGSIRQLTHDHTYVQRLVDAGMLSPEAAAAHQLRNALTNVLGGGKRSVDVDLQRLRVAAGDRLLLCSDGLTGTMKDEEIADLLGRSASAEDSCRRLVDLALERGAPDNVTVIVARYELS
ncbi:MAG TPA: protein phosphatase 2C domain-containing protein [Candidatus Polarisedimenticolia bacterium]|nr:protein phosphatase 2C domain-containing protein [Candidatus Polarisedimenticolia bacterium]